MIKPLLIRADVNVQMGTGHLMRCLALAQAWKAQGGEVMFITACDSPSLLQRLADEGFDTLVLERAYPDPDDWKVTSQVLATYPDSWVVLDGYHFDSGYQLKVKEAMHRLLVIDDMAHLEHYYADIVLNQNIHAEQLVYICEPYTRLLLGTCYALLRREFWPWREWRREIPDVAHKVLVTLGGSDPDNQTLKVIQALQQVEVADLKIVVVVGASNPYRNELESAVRHSPFTIQILHNVTNMPELMAWADLVVTGGGSTCWELAFMGTPGIIMVLADNQAESSRVLDEQHAFISLGYSQLVKVEDIRDVLQALVFDSKRRRALSQVCNLLVDGQGVAQVVNHIIHRNGEEK